MFLLTNVQLGIFNKEDNVFNYQKKYYHLIINF